MRQLLNLSLAALLLAGCSNTVPVIQSAVIDCGPDPTTDTLSLLPVKPYSLVAGVESHICMSPEDYTRLAENMVMLKAHIQQKNAIVKFYRECIERNKQPSPEL